MPADQDFAAYAAARWPALLRVLVLLGCPPRLAPDVVLDGLARSSRSWRSSRRGDVEVAVHADLLDAWDRRRRTGAWWEEPHPAPVVVPTLLEHALDAMPAHQRTALVLHEVAGLQPGQVAEAADLAPDQVEAVLSRIMKGQRPDGVPDLRLADVPVDPPPAPGVAEVRDRRRVLRRRGRATVLRRGALVVPVVALLAVGGWLLSRPAPPEPEVLGPVRSEPAENPVEVVWFADGVLHLPQAEVRLPSVVQVAAVRDGAVYVDGRARVVHVEEDGTRTELGVSASGVRLVTSPEEGWAAWQDASTGDLVLQDVVAGDELDRVSGEGLEPVAVDDGRLFYNDLAGAYQLRPGEEAELVAPARLLDVRSGVQVLDGGTRTAQLVVPSGAGDAVVFAEAAQLNEGATVLLTRRRGDEGLGGLQFYDVRTRDGLPSGIGEGEVPIAASFGPDETVVYVLARAEDRPGAGEYGRSSFSGGLELRTCSVRTGWCEDELQFRSTVSTPLLAR